MSIFKNNSETSSIDRKLIAQYLNQRPVLKSFVIGAFSGTCSTLLFQPFDLIKTRVQNAQFSIVSEVHSSTTAATNFRSTSANRFIPILSDVIKNEQIIGLWRGTVPSLFRCVPGLGIHFCCLDTLQNHFCPNHKPTPLQAISFGMVSRSIASVLLIPATVVKTRYESGVFKYRNLTDALRHTYRSDGVRGLCSGLLPTLMRDAPFSGLYFLFYSQLKQLIPNDQNELKYLPKQYSNSTILSSSSLTFLCGLSAGLLASMVTQPMDVIKTRMQLKPQEYSSFIRTTFLMIKKEKFRNLFAGLLPRMMRRTLMASMSWTVYEQMMRSLCLK
ncbi:hypothetical protein NH340_JMT00903 [Sarcoptes scabiei]|uniref:Mitochondrial glycine transporter n=1 Tax=Sarcoptes scabiei TaxID=52283 RepID=A0A132A3D0_SARSC|nr:solute carrier family 25 member 38-like protein [Sarcoptes scabiei]UXI14960.1 hypothetical protein NH340_JMT00903 [Sarcoptes scabiei]